MNNLYPRAAPSPGLFLIKPPPIPRQSVEAQDDKAKKPLCREYRKKRRSH